MNRIGTFQLAVMFCGCFLGAGFLSGNELWQFFASFGIKGLIGSVLAVILIGLFCGFIISISIAKKTENPEKVLFPTRYNKSSMLFGALQALLVFTVIVIMCAGSSTLANNLIGVNRSIVAFVFCVVLATLVLLGINSIVNAFSLIIPFIAIASIVIGSIVIIKNGGDFIIPEGLNSVNPLLNNWIVSTITYLSYSIFSSVGVFSAVSGKVKSGKTLWGGIALGSFIMSLMALVIILVIWCNPNAVSAELPMLSAALSIGRLFGGIYAVLLLFGMLGAALSCYMALSNYFRIKFAINKKMFTIVVIVIAIGAFFGSLFGFGDLVGTIYPIFGYIGIVVLILIIFNYIKHYKC